MILRLPLAESGGGSTLTLLGASVPWPKPSARCDKDETCHVGEAENLEVLAHETRTARCRALQCFGLLA